ncbi:prepilin peptidase [Chitinivibrio alkaliphilus]|uniref:Prepilin leader peptidase/N-methyltransferase n=1 Tax=Chitinivibrio alkaliphilus ACht1 TaxID=1313304 RepID=U7D6P6_9BACT|nr:A24 family peptidase [Chitinivibrio alkaliphilus]ERP32189.1 type IV pilus prepilin peptidase PilD [Chitinivibrio alkaliphilus ACht1]
MEYSPIYMGLAFFGAGLLFGSFFNVLIHRMPLGLSIISPRSRCPRCENTLSWYDNIPVVSYLYLRGKCRFCAAPISQEYPAVELATGIFSTMLYYFLFRHTIQEQHVAVFFLQYATLVLLIPISLIDMHHYIIPDSFTLGGLVLAMLLSFVPGGLSPVEAFLGAICGGGILLFFALTGKKFLGREAMGGGDVKMLAWFGAVWGAPIAAGTIFLGALVGLVFSVVFMIRGEDGANTPIPFGPALYLGLCISLLWGEPLWYAYMSLF